MAEMIIDRWHLAVLRVVLDLGGREPVVASTMVGYPGGQRREFWTRRDTLDGFGLEAATPDAPPTALRVPEALRDAAVEVLTSEFRAEAALWLRIVAPSGYLGAVPWEEAFAGRMTMPVLRVPDRLPVPTDPGRTWSVAALVNAAAGGAWGAEHVVRLIDALTNFPRRVELDVFPDAGTHELLLGRIPARAQGYPDVTVHDPATARPAFESRRSRGVRQFRRPGEDRGGRPWAASTASPDLLWADWVTEGLSGRAMRALHVVSDATMDGDVPLLALAFDPAEALERSRCAYVGGDQVRQLADALGAAALSFGSPPGNPSDVATRLLADAAGLVRPGPTVYVDLRTEWAEFPLGQLHAFLAAPDDARLPTDPRLFAYLQPEHLQPALVEPPPAVEPPLDTGLESSTPRTRLLTSSDDDVQQAYGDADVVPSWVAASERYLDAGVAKLIRASAPPAEGTAPPTFPGVDTKAAYDDGTAYALEQLRELVNRHASQS